VEIASRLNFPRPLGSREDAAGSKTSYGEDFPVVQNLEHIRAFIHQRAVLHVVNHFDFGNILCWVETSRHRSIAAQQFNRCWDFLEMDHRTPGDDVELLTAAFASRFHWLQAGNEGNWVTADWMVSRAAAAVGDGDLAVRFALLAQKGAQSSEIADWLRASVTEGLARAYACAGMNELRKQTELRARELIDAIQDPENKDLILRQLESIPK
jgi:hypothetical protein